MLAALNSCTLTSTNRYDLFLTYGVNKTSHTSRTFQRILLVYISTVFCNAVIFVLVPMVFNLFCRALAGVPRAPITNGTTDTFIFHTFFSSLARSKVNYLGFMVFFINENHVRPSCSYKMVYLYSKILKDFARVILSDRFWLMLIPFLFNMDSIRSTNFPMNTAFRSNHAFFCTLSEKVWDIHLQCG